MKAKYTYWKIKLRLVLIVLFIGLNVGCHFNQEEAAASEIHFIDTGNSDAILIKQGNYAALIDGGDNDDEELIPEYIKKQGIKQLDYVFFTQNGKRYHSISDCSGMKSPIQEMLENVGDRTACSKCYE